MAARQISPAVTATLRSYYPILLLFKLYLYPSSIFLNFIIITKLTCFRQNKHTQKKQQKKHMESALCDKGDVMKM